MSVVLGLNFLARYFGPAVVEQAIGCRLFPSWSRARLQSAFARPRQSGSSKCRVYSHESWATVAAEIFECIHGHLTGSLNGTAQCPSSHHTIALDTLVHTDIVELVQRALSPNLVNLLIKSRSIHVQSSQHPRSSAFAQPQPRPIFKFNYLTRNPPSDNQWNLALTSFATKMHTDATSSVPVPVTRHRIMALALHLARHHRHIVPRPFTCVVPNPIETRPRKSRSVTRYHVSYPHNPVINAAV